ncbi:D-glycerate dehydrogenase [Dehalococcoidia bacterium]|nr:D-glycerate dehydrogenase [Dehalococcoidia bacterium]
MLGPKVYVTRPIFPETIDLLSTVAEVRVWPEDTAVPGLTLKEELQNADGLFSVITDTIDRALLDSASKLRVVSNMGVGYNNIDVPVATSKGIYVANTPGVLTETTADLAFALMAACARRIPEGRDFVRRGDWTQWSPVALLGMDLHSATLGIVGLGRIGLAVAKRAKGFSMRVLYHSRTRNLDCESRLGLEWVDNLSGLLSKADFVSVHVPLNEKTRGMIDRKQLAEMKPTAVLVNTARGEIINQEALCQALRNGAIGGAALDVTDPEPIPRDDPLLALDNVIITPHIGSASHATRVRMATLAAQNILDVIQGHPPTYCVNPEAKGKREVR